MQTKQAARRKLERLDVNGTFFFCCGRKGAVRCERSRQPVKDRACKSE